MPLAGEPALAVAASAANDELTPLAAARLAGGELAPAAAAALVVGGELTRVVVVRLAGRFTRTVLLTVVREPRNTAEERRLAMAPRDVGCEPLAMIATATVTATARNAADAAARILPHDQLR